MLPSEIRTSVLAFISECGSCTVAEIMSGCEIDQSRGMNGARWRLYAILKDLEDVGLVESWAEPGTRLKHWRPKRPS